MDSGDGDAVGSVDGTTVGSGLGVTGGDGSGVASGVGDGSGEGKAATGPAEGCWALRLNAGKNRLTNTKANTSDKKTRK